MHQVSRNHLHTERKFMSMQGIFDSKIDTPQLTQTEKLVSSIWAEVLQVDKVHPEDNFFELGGDSLMTMMVLFRVNDILHVELPPYSISQSPTLREFCKVIDESRDLSEEQDLPDDIDSFDGEAGVI